MNWEQIKQLDEENQINAINDLLQKYPDKSISKIEIEILNITKGIISNNMKRKGYRLINDGVNRYYEMSSNTNITKVIQGNDNNNNSITNNYKSNMDSITLLYMTINKYLQEQKTNTKLIPTTIKITDINNERIGKFLEKHLILNKQDVINLAIQEFLNKYD